MRKNALTTKSGELQSDLIRSPHSLLNTKGYARKIDRIEIFCLDMPSEIA